MATITHTLSGHWNALIRRTGWPAVSKTFRLKQDAVRWARHTEDGMVLGVYRFRPPSEKMLFDAAMKRYIAEVAPRKSPSSRVSDQYRAQILTAFFGAYWLEAIEPQLVVRFREARLATPKRQTRWQAADSNIRISPATVRLEMILLSHLFTVARQEWQTGPMVNPVSQVRLPPQAPSRTRRLDGSDEEILFRVLARHPNPMLGWICRLAIETAMRASEIRTLKVSQINFEHRIILLTDTKNGCARMVPLSRTATEVLRTAVALPTRPANCPFVFFGQVNADGVCSGYRFQHAWWRLRIKTELGDLRFHDLRHEAISRLVEAGLGDLEVAAISGHKAMQMLKRYTHLRSALLVKKLDQIDRRRRRSADRAR